MEALHVMGCFDVVMPGVQEQQWVQECDGILAF
jgi:hypothetical protein